jgi:hypothetical protein
LSADELAAIDEFRFQTRMPTRAAAVRELLRRGLASAVVEVRNSSGEPEGTKADIP